MVAVPHEYLLLPAQGHDLAVLLGFLVRTLAAGSIRGACGHALDGTAQPIRFHGLEEIIGRAELEGLQGVLIVRRYKDNARRDGE